jgi:diguanylate cyclase (GGDEF)-like protein/PAS domain S-box-containing protein
MSEHPSPATHLELEQLRQELAALNEQLQKRNAQLQQAQLRHESLETELRQMQQTLEVQVMQRTASALKDNTQLQQDIEAYCSAEDQLQANEAALRQSQERLDGILASLEDVVWSFVPYTFQILYLNTATEQVYGRSVAEFIDNLNLWLEVVHPEDRERVEQSHAALYTSGSQDIEYRILWPNGNIRWLRSRARLIQDKDGSPIRIDGITTDITERQRIQEQLRYDALHDGLTGLANRPLLMACLEQVIRQRQRQEHQGFAVLFLDLDRFKVINDSLGHLVGDQLLIAVARRLERCLRVGDMVARLGGDEFVILLNGIASPQTAVDVAQRIHQALVPPIIVDQYQIFVTASIGITISSQHTYKSHDQANHLLRDADTAMYRAKALGKGRHEVFDPSMHVYALKRWQLENDLRRAIERQELLVYYQPIVDLATNQVHGFEALLRWHHPDLGLVSPLDIIPIAEETGLIITIDQWVLRTACEQLSAWQDQFPSLNGLMISVNLSGRHFSQPGLVQFVEQVLRDTGLPGRVVKLEITESVVIDHAESVMAILKQLQHLKVQVSLDDFGTGYSSLSYLHYFPFSTLKVDRSFVSQIEKRQDRKQIVKTIVDLGLALGMNVVAEGIETGEQLMQLQQFKCPYGQGYWFSKPVSSHEMTEQLQTVNNGILDGSSGSDIVQLNAH